MHALTSTRAAEVEEHSSHTAILSCLSTLMALVYQHGCP